jgi:heat shock protein HslJ
MLAAVLGITAAGTAAAEPVLRASGNEPGWSAVVDAIGLELTTDYGERRLKAATYTVEAVAGRRVYRAEAEGLSLVVTAAETICTDTMSGMQRPLTVEVKVGEDTLTGCGGESASLLTGVEWAVERIDGQEAVTGSAPSVGFDAEGNVYGQGSCNRYRGGYQLTGESLTMGPFATTMMACPPPLMEQERRFLELLAKVTGFAVGADGSLELRTGAGPTIVARRP